MFDTEMALARLQFVLFPFLSQVAYINNLCKDKPDQQRPSFSSPSVDLGVGD